MLGERAFAPDVGRAEVAGAGGGDLDRWRSREHKDEAMAGHRRLAVVVRRLYDQGRLDAILSMGGSGGTSIAAAAMRTLPAGVPKLVASTVGGGAPRTHHAAQPGFQPGSRHRPTLPSTDRPQTPGPSTPADNALEAGSAGFVESLVRTTGPGCG